MTEPKDDRWPTYMTYTGMLRQRIKWTRARFDARMLLNDLAADIYDKAKGYSKAQVNGIMILNRAADYLRDTESE